MLINFERFFFVYRWLLANGKTKKAKKIVGNFAASKRKILDDQTWKLIVQTENKKVKIKFITKILPRFLVFLCLYIKFYTLNSEGLTLATPLLQFF